MLTIFVLAALLLLLIVTGYTLRGGRSNPPVVGSSAPDFTLNSQDQQPVKLSALRGQWVVLYFYPKDFTSGCTLEARNFQRDLPEYQKRNSVVLGVSAQDEATHKQFCAKEGLNFKLLADTKTEVSKLYASVVNLGVTKLSSRHTFLIDPQGVLRKTWLDVDVKSHSKDVLAAIEDFQKE
jgi:thioredoxin-dependent peroxiredoxin